MGNGQIRLTRPPICGKLGHPKRDQNGSHQTHGSRNNQKGENPLRGNPKESEWDLSSPEPQSGRYNGVRCHEKKARVQHLGQRVPTNNVEQFMPLICQTWKSSGGMPKPGQEQGRSNLGTTKRQQKAMGATSQSKGNGSGQENGRRIGKRRKSPVSNGLRDKTKPKPIEISNLYATLNNTETLDNENDHIMVQIGVYGGIRHVTINAMNDSGATEDFFDKELFSKYGSRTTRAKKTR